MMNDPATSARSLGFALFACAIWGGVNGCSGHEAVGTRPSALHGAGPAPDTVFTSVAELGGDGCSAAILSDNTAIAAGHCFERVGHRCEDAASYIAGMTVNLSLDGQTTTAAYTIDRVAVHPRAYLNMATCAPNAPNSCANAGSSGTAGLSVGFDLSLIHFTVAANQNPPSVIGGSSMFHPVITSVANSTSSPVGTVHVQGLDMTQAITSSTFAWHAGWGDSDWGSWGQFRFAGTQEFVNTGTSFGQSCETWPTCWNTTNTSVSCNGNLGQFADVVFEAQRWGQPGAYYGVAADAGDSGSPLYVHAGTNGGDVGALVNVVGGPYFQIGVTSESDGLFGGGVQIDANTQVTNWFAPTWTQDTGSWIDQTLQKWATDLDEDGRPNAFDNCPTVPNTAQDDTNLLAEQTLSDTPAGDACDVNATTRGTAGGEWNSPVMGPCTQVVINGNQTFTLSTNGTCPVVYNSAITMRGNIGNAKGNAPLAIGGAFPSYCDCPDANGPNSANCKNPFTSNCVIANDNADPNLYPRTTGWMTMTQYVNGADQLYPFVSLYHEDPSDWAIQTQVWHNLDVTTHWDYMADTAAAGHNGATSLLGQLWTHLPPDSQHFFPSPGESLPAVNRPSHYTDFKAFQHNGYVFGIAPPLVNVYVPFWVKVIDGGPEAPYLLPGNDASGVVHVLSDSAAGLLMADDRFDGSALGALYGVARHTADLFVADEAVASDGALAPQATRAIVTYANDTSIQAGLSRPYQVFSAALTANAPTNFVTSVRAYSATTGQLYAIKGARTFWNLYAFDVASALANAPTQTSVLITGVSLRLPSAMAYNATDGNLYVVDKPLVGSLTALRLLRLSPSGVATTLWQTTGDSSPPSVYLSISPIGEIVLGLGIGTQSAEVVVLDTDGHPWGSAWISNQLLARPVASESGVSALLGNADRAFPTTYFDRSSLTHGLCATAWLQAHVDTTTKSPLGYPAGDCP